MARRKRRNRRQKGSGQLLFKKAGRKKAGRWSIRWRENGRYRFKGGIPDRETAERALKKVLGEIAQNRAGLPPDPRGLPTLSELADAWLDRRDHTHRGAVDDRCRWKVHLRPAFGGLRASEVDAACIRKFVEDRLRAGLNPATVQRCVRTLSTFYSDLCERPRETGAVSNPVRTLPRSTRRLMRPTWDWKHTPSLAAAWKLSGLR